MSAPHCIHLLTADAGLAEGHRLGKYLAVCGALLGVSELPSALCSGDCESEITYCPGCIRAANEHNYDAGLDVGCPACVHAAERHNAEAARASGAVIHEDGSWSVHVS